MSSVARVTQKPATTLPPAVTPLPVRRFTLAEYHKLFEVGVFQSGDPYELLNGVIVAKMAQNSPHASASSRLERGLGKFLPDDYSMRTGKPVTLPNSNSELEPDVAVVSGPEDKYDTRHPGPKDVAFVVEVSDASLGRDAGEKLGAYPGAKVLEYWILDVNDRRVEVYTQPRGGKNPTYKQRTDYGPDELVPVVVGGRPVGTIAVKELLP